MVLLSAVLFSLATFFGGWLAPAQAAEGRIGGRRPEVMAASFSGMVVTLFLPSELVQSWLPPGLQLDAECPYKDRPVIILFGTIDDLTRTKVVTVKPRFGRHYMETFIAVPYLKLAAAPQSQPVSHFVRIYSDSGKGTSIGIQRYGWPKITVPMATTDDTYRIVYNNDTVLSAQIDNSQAKAVDISNPSVKAVQDMLTQPLVLLHDGKYHYHFFDFHFEAASVTSTSVDLQLSPSFMPQMPPINKKYQGVAETDFGAFHVECRYTSVVPK
jgi:hypothetical protein